MNSRVAVTGLSIVIGVANAQTRPVRDHGVDRDADGVSVTEKGEIEKKPETEEQWDQLRAAAVALVESTNLDAITEAGGTIDEACESCHLQFWYPGQR